MSRRDQIAFCLAIAGIWAAACNADRVQALVDNYLPFLKALGA